MSLLCVLTRSPRTKAGILSVPFFFQAGPIEMFGYDTVTEWSDFDTLGGKRFSRPVSKGLSVYEFDSMFTDYLLFDVPAELHGYVANLEALGLHSQSIDAVSSHPFFAPPTVRVEQLRTIQEALTPMILTMADSSVLRAPVGAAVATTEHELSVEVTLRTVHSEERHGEMDARYVHLSFTDYESIQLATSARGGSKGAAVGAAAPNGYRAKLTIKNLTSAQCTVARLAKLYYGDASKTAPIFKANSPWLQEFSKDENLRAFATGTVTQTTRTKRLKALLAKHPQILVPNLPPTAAKTRAAGTTFVGAS